MTCVWLVSKGVTLSDQSHFTYNLHDLMYDLIAKGSHTVWPITCLKFTWLRYDLIAKGSHSVWPTTSYLKFTGFMYDLIAKGSHSVWWPTTSYLKFTWFLYDLIAEGSHSVWPIASCLNDFCGFYMTGPQRGHTMSDQSLPVWYILWYLWPGGEEVLQVLTNLFLFEIYIAALLTNCFLFNVSITILLNVSVF